MVWHMEIRASSTRDWSYVTQGWRVIMIIDPSVGKNSVAIQKGSRGSTWKSSQTILTGRRGVPFHWDPGIVWAGDCLLGHCSGLNNYSTVPYS